MAISICNTLTDVPCVFPVCSLQAGLHFSVYFKTQKHTLSLHAALPPNKKNKSDCISSDQLHRLREARGGIGNASTVTLA